MSNTEYRLLNVAWKSDINKTFKILIVFQVVSRSLPTQSGNEAIDKDGVLFFGLIGECTLACYNIYGNEMDYDKIVTDKKLLDFLITMKVGFKPRSYYIVIFFINV